MLPESSSRPLLAKMAHSRNLAHASLETAVIPFLVGKLCRPLPSSMGDVLQALPLTSVARSRRRVEVYRAASTGILQITSTGFSSEIGTKLRESAFGQAGGSCYPRAALSSNDSKTQYKNIILLTPPLPAFPPNNQCKILNDKMPRRVGFVKLLPESCTSASALLPTSLLPTQGKGMGE